MDYYLIKPNMSRILMPSVAIFLALEMALLLGIIINFSLIDIGLNSIYFGLAFLLSLTVCVFVPIYYKYHAYYKIGFYFYGDRLMFNSYIIPYNKIVNVTKDEEMHPTELFFDKIFNTGTINIEVYDENLGQNRSIKLENVQNTNEMVNYIIQVIANYRNYTGTGL